MEIMYDAVDITEEDQQPYFESNFIAYFYFVAFIGKLCLMFDPQSRQTTLIKISFGFSSK